MADDKTSFTPLGAVHPAATARDRPNSAPPRDAAEQNNSTVPTRAPPRPKATVATFLLSVIRGPDAGKTFRIDGSQAFRVLVGTSPVCAFRLSDPHVSRRHAALDSAGAELRLTDLKSMNGTAANGVVVVEAHLKGGEVLDLGDTRIQVARAEGMSTVALSSATSFGRVFGASEAMRRLYPLFEKAAVGDAPVLLEGEPGTGKELVAETLHERGVRSAGSFVLVDPSTIPHDRLDAELFGDGETGGRRGAVARADGGTLYITEIAALPAAAQARLASLFAGRPDASGRSAAPAVRLVAATEENLDEAIQHGRFDAGLFGLLCGGRIELPPLRRRTGDATLLAAHFYRTLTGDGTPPPDDLLAEVARHDFPGNVSDLHGLVVRRVTQSELGKKHLGADLVPAILAMDWPLPRARQHLVTEFERLYVDRIVDKHGGHIGRAAAASGLAQRYFQLLRARHKRRDGD